MAKGTITRFVDDRGFGFIKQDGKEEDVFFHQSAFEGTPREGISVEFDTEASDRGPRAVNVRPAE